MALACVKLSLTYCTTSSASICELCVEFCHAVREDETPLAVALMCASNVQLTVEQDAWNAALARARGERILDDPKLLSRCGAWL